VLKAADTVLRYFRLPAAVPSGVLNKGAVFFVRAFDPFVTENQGCTSAESSGANCGRVPSWRCQ